MTCSVCLLCGLPGSGKTTLANYLCEMGLKDNFKFICVSYDSIMPLVDHRTEQRDKISPWKMERRNILQNVQSTLEYIMDKDSLQPLTSDKNAAQSHFRLIHENMKEFPSNNHIVVIIDDNMQYRGMRYEYYRICARLGIGFATVYFDVSVQNCVTNNEKRGRPVSSEVIAKMSHQLEVPGTNPKSKWEKHICFLKNEDLSHLATAFNKVMEIIQISIADPAYLPKETTEEAEKTRIRNRESFIHQADICIRRFISNEINKRKQDTSPVALKELTSRLANIKKKLLSLMNSGYVEEDGFFDENGLVDVETLEKKISGLILVELG